MKFVVLIAAAMVGALATIALPPTFSAASHELRPVRLSDFNPLRAIFDYGQHGIRAGKTPEERGIHTAATKLKPMTVVPPSSLKLDLSRAFEAQAETQIQNNRRMGDIQANTRNPGHGLGPASN
jgi:hypothetical protein